MGDEVGSDGEGEGGGEGLHWGVKQEAREPQCACKEKTGRGCHRESEGAGERRQVVEGERRQGLQQEGERGVPHTATLFSPEQPAQATGCATSCGAP